MHATGQPVVVILNKVDAGMKLDPDEVAEDLDLAERPNARVGRRQRPLLRWKYLRGVNRRARRLVLSRLGGTEQSMTGGFYTC